MFRSSDMFPIVRRLALTMLAVAMMAGCADKKEGGYRERQVGDLYNAGMDALLIKEYPTAAALFDEVERQHPYSVWATKSQLMAAYAHYQDNRYDDAVIALDRFIQLHPGSADVAYAYYLKALCFYEQISGVGRDQQMTALALGALLDVVRRFPNSTYARDATLKIDLTKDHLAGKHMMVGRYYLRQGHYLAAINRFRAVVDDFQTTSHVPEALHRLAEAYTALGLTKEARKVAAVLGHNFPDSEWYSDSYAIVESGGGQGANKQEKSWFGRTWDGIF